MTKKEETIQKLMELLEQGPSTPADCNRSSIQLSEKQLQYLANIKLQIEQLRQEIPEQHEQLYLI